MSVRFRLPAVRFVRVGVSLRCPLRMVCRPCLASACAASISLWVGVAVLTALVPAASGRRFGGFRWRVPCPLVCVGCRPCCVPLLRLPASDVRRPVALPKRETAHPVKSAPLAASVRCGRWLGNCRKDCVLEVFTPLHVLGVAVLKARVYGFPNYTGYLTYAANCRFSICCRRT